ncbi:MAG: response regulator [Actinomycetota bacterium]|nr:response regulator [Actinomycetota bacterium]
MTRRLLLVDDDDGVRLVARTALERVGGWAVTAVSSGEEALGQAATDPPDAILLDVMMPGLDGPATLAELRTNPLTAHIPVIFLTAKARTTHHARLLELGASGVLVKPFDPMQLSNEVAAVLGFGP